MDIYQAIWDADMKGNGLQPIMADGHGDKKQGYVVVNTENCSSSHYILQEVHIPDQKRRSYQLIEKLFDNYTLNQWRMEKNTPSEWKEVKEFLKMAINSLPVQLAKNFIEEKLNHVFSGEEWFTYLYTLWFNQFDWETSQDLSGFEHVYVGEQKGKKLVGHHFWYKYWLEDNLHEQIEMNCALQDENRQVSPYVVTLGYHLKAYDDKKRHYIRIGKKRCAFFVGLSGEGLLALGSVRAVPDGTVPGEFVLNNVRYKLELYRSPDGKSIRTFYPIPIIENTGSS